MILAGDIGGTKTVLALVEPSGGGFTPVHEATFPSRSYPTFDTLMGEFLADRPRESLGAACLGVAGIVIDGRCQTTNLPWELEESALASLIGVPRVKLLNDLEASALGMLQLRPDEVSVLQRGTGAGTARRGNVGVIAAGTGLGEAILYWDGTQYHPIASEGGHADFGPRNPLEIELLLYLRDRFGGHVSYERVLSGPGFHNIYLFLRDSGHVAESPGIAAEFQHRDPNAVISEVGVDRTDPLCTATVDLFCSIYGAEAGNLALRCVALGGVYVAGGIAPRMIAALRERGFLEAFSAKGRYSGLMKQVEVRVALNPRAPLLGAAYFALRL